MKFLTNLISLFFLFLFCSLSNSQTISKNPYGFKDIDFADKLLRIGAGPKGGLIYPIGESICNLINKNTDFSKVRCVLIETPGSEFNVMGIGNGSFEIALSQGDNLVRMTADQDDGPTPLRLVSILGYAPINLYVKNNINSLDDLKGKKYNANIRGTGHAASGLDFLNVAKLDQESFNSTVRISPAEIGKEFCGQKIDFGIFTGPHPLPLFNEIFKCNGKLLQIPKEMIESMKENVPTSKSVQISKGIYSNFNQEISSLAVPLVLISSDQVDQEAIYRLVKILKNNFELFTSKFPYLSRQLSSLEEMKELNFELHDGTVQALTNTN
jgi:TRAP transporter TAXI family solute receptor